MTTIEKIQIRTDKSETASRFYARAFGAEFPVESIPDEAQPRGFDGFAISIITAQPADTDLVIAHAVECGATIIKPAKKSLWGYGGTISSPDGSILTIASEAKKDSAPAHRRVTDIVLQLGASDVIASKNFYVDHGLTLSKSYGKRYAEFATEKISVILNRRIDVAKQAGVADSDPVANRLFIASDAGSFTDPDGFVWN